MLLALMLCSRLETESLKVEGFSVEESIAVAKLIQLGIAKPVVAPSGYWIARR